MLKIILHIIFIVLAVSIQRSFLSGFVVLNNLNLLLIMAVFMATLDFKLAILWVFLGGVLGDMYSLYPWLSVTLSLLLSVLVARILFLNIFTNKSFGALSILILIGTLIYNLLFLSLIYCFYLLKKTSFYINLDFNYLVNLSWQVLENLIFSVIIFYLVNSMKQRLSKSFLVQS